MGARSLIAARWFGVESDSPWQREFAIQHSWLGPVLRGEYNHNPDFLRAYAAPTRDVISPANAALRWLRGPR